MDKMCAFDNGKKCLAISPKDCAGCRFRKTESELEAGREKARYRLSQFPPEQQKHYDDMYHNQYMRKF